MGWEYLDIRFRLTFLLKTIQRKRLFGRIVQAYDTPEEIDWEIIAAGGNKEEVLFKGTAKREMGFLRFNTAQYGIRSVTWEYTALCDFKTVCFKYLQRLGAEGWELHGELPEKFTRTPDAAKRIIGHIIDIPESSQRDNDFFVSASLIGPTIDLWNSSFFFKRWQNT